MTTSSTIDANNKSVDPVTMFDLIEALEQVIRSSANDHRQTLAITLDGYMKDFPDEFFWATGAKSPSLLFQLMMTIDTSSRDDLCDACAAAAVPASSTQH